MTWQHPLATVVGLEVGLCHKLAQSGTDASSPSVQYNIKMESLAPLQPFYHYEGSQSGDEVKRRNRPLPKKKKKKKKKKICRKRNQGLD